MKLSKKWTTVTPLSKALAGLLFILLPILAFYLGFQYKAALDMTVATFHPQPEVNNSLDNE